MSQHTDRESEDAQAAEAWAFNNIPYREDPSKSTVVDAFLAGAQYARVNPISPAVAAETRLTERACVESGTAKATQEPLGDSDEEAADNFLRESFPFFSNCYVVGRAAFTAGAHHKEKRMAGGLAESEKEYTKYFLACAVLEKENKRLRSALEKIANHKQTSIDKGYLIAQCEGYQTVAREALSQAGLEDGDGK